MRSALLLWVFLCTGPLWAQPASPPPPEKYRVLIRYRIIAVRDTHVEVYRSLIKHLESLDFELLPQKKPKVKESLLDQLPYTDQEDPGKDRLEGVISSGKALKILEHGHVAGLVLKPADWKDPDPDDLIKPVRVRLELAAGFRADRQRELADQVRVLLATLGFREAVGYDHHGHSGRPFTRLAGTIPAGMVDLLVKDLRRQPTGWFTTDLDDRALPSPLRQAVPIRIVEVLPDAEPLATLPLPEKRTPDFLNHITPDLWTLVKDKALADKVVRVQVVLALPPDPANLWKESLLRAAPNLFIEGHLGQFVTGLVPVNQVPTLASLPNVSTVRLPAPARVQVDPGVKIKADNARALKQTGLDELHKKGFRGKGVRLAIIDTDFRGYEEMIRSKQLPAKTQLVDLTTERNAALYPDPAAGDPKQLGHGTQCALAAALAAPEAELVLIRIDGTAPFQIHQVLRRLAGEAFVEHLDRRRDEILSAWVELRAQRQVILKERRAILDDFTDDTELMRDFEFLGPLRGWIFSAREWSLQRLTYQDLEEKILKNKEDRFWKFLGEIQGLKGIRLAATPLVWNDGYPLAQLSPLSQWFDTPLPPLDKGGKRRLPALYSPRSALHDLLWFQSAGNVRGQTWNGFFHDDDSNGVMEFAPPQTPLQKGQWSHELSFLAWQPYEADRTLDLPAKTRVRLSLQWGEPHDPAYFIRPGEDDHYRQPLAPLRLVVLRQRDPEGKTLAGDSLEVVAQSSGLPQRLDNRPTRSIYEQTLEFTVDQPGRYAVRIERQLPTAWELREDKDGRPVLHREEGLVATGIRPPKTVSLPGMEKTWELRTRLLAHVVDEPHRLMGRPIWRDYATQIGTLGIPADARAVNTIGAANFDDKTQSYSPTGPPANLDLYRHPPLLAYDALQIGPEGTGGAYGTSVSACFAAGMAASLLSSGMSPPDLHKHLNRQRGKVLKVLPAPK